jgi:hypothetical protein
MMGSCGSCVHWRRGKVGIRRSLGFSKNEMWSESTGAIARSRCGAWSERRRVKDDDHRSLALTRKWRTEESLARLTERRRGPAGVKADVGNKVGGGSGTARGVMEGGGGLSADRARTRRLSGDATRDRVGGV